MTNFKMILTNAGIAKVVNATMTGKKLDIVQFAVGDATYEPEQSMTALKNLKWRGPVAAVEVEKNNPFWITVTCPIPAEHGGFWIREVGLYDADGDLVAIGRAPDSYKPIVAEGASKDFVIEPIIEVSNASSVTLRIDPNVIQASRYYVNTRVEQVNQQLAQVKVNPTFENSKKDSIQLGSEMLSDLLTVTLGTGWTGTIANGFTHSSNNTANLIIDIPSLVVGDIYQVEINMTNPAVNDDGQSDYWVSLGGSPEFETYKGTTSRHVWGLKVISGTQLIIRPWTGYSGKINISLKRVIGSIDAYSTYKDTNNNTALEQRVSPAAQKSIYFGNNSGRYANEFAEQNVVIGHDAGHNVTSGFWNVFVGQEAGRDNTVGSRNVFVGRVAGASNDNGDRNVAVGSWALMRNRTGRNNIAIGADANYYNESGDRNIAIGTLALGESETGNQNIAIGYHASGKNKTGSNNIAMGDGAMLANETGSDNIALGRVSLAKNGMSNNIAIGKWTLRESLYGEKNIAIGNESMRYIQDGDSNITVGVDSLKNQTKGSNNVAVGTSSMRYSNESNDNVAIGNNALYGVTKADGNVAIGAGAMGGANLENEERDIKRNVVIGRNAGAWLEDGAHYNVIVGSASGFGLRTGQRNILIGYDIHVPNTYTSDSINIGNTILGNQTTKVVEIAKLKLTELPTSAPAESGLIWNDGGTLKIS